MSAQAAGLGVEWREASRLRACSGVGLEGSLLDDPLCCPAIARGSTVGCLPWGGADEFVGADRDGLRPIGVVAQGQTEPLQQLESFEPAGGSVKGDGRLTAAQPVG